EHRHERLDGRRPLDPLRRRAPVRHDDEAAVALPAREREQPGGLVGREDLGLAAPEAGAHPLGPQPVRGVLGRCDGAGEEAVEEEQETHRRAGVGQALTPLPPRYSPRSSHPSMSAMTASAISPCSTVPTTSPRLKRWARPRPRLTPRSAPAASPGPLTAHPISATLRSFVNFFRSTAASTSSTTENRSPASRPHVGHAMTLTPGRPSRRLLRMAWPTSTSFTESAARLTRMVSPMPSASRLPMPMALLMVPVRTEPDSVTPRCSG